MPLGNWKETSMSGAERSKVGGAGQDPFMPLLTGHGKELRFLL